MTPHEAVEKHSRLVYSNAWRFKGFCRRFAHFDIEDIIQVGFIGLLKGAEKYDPSLGFSESTYLTKWIRGEILKFLRDHMAAFKMSRKIKLKEKYNIGTAASLNAHATNDDDHLEFINLFSVDGDYTEILITDIIDRYCNEKQRIVFRMYVRGATQSEIAQKIGISQVHVSRHLAKIRDVLARE